MNNSIKRAQSQARLSFAERENFRPKVRQYKKLMMTLALLLTAVTGAWARGGVIMKELTVPSEWNQDVTYLTVNEMTGFKDFSSLTEDEAKALLNSVPTGKVIIIYGAGASSNSFKLVQNDGVDVSVVDNPLPHELLFFLNDDYKYYYTTSDAIEVNPVAVPAANTQQWTFTQPGSNVVLTPIYARTAAFATTGTEPEVTTLLPAAAEGVIAGTDAPLIVEGTVAFAGTSTEARQGTVMYAVTAATDTEAPALTSSDWKNTVPTAKDIADGGAEVKVWYYIQGADAPQGEAATLDNTFNNSAICATPLTVTVLSNLFDLTLKAANVNTIEAGMATVTVKTGDADAVDKTADIDENHQLKDVKMGSEVTMTTATGYKFRKVSSQAYGICVYNDGESWPKGFITFNIDDPSNVSVLNGNAGDSYYGLDYCPADGYYYACEPYNYQLLKMDLNGNIVGTVATTLDTYLTDGAWNPINNTMYALYGETLYTINLSTGEVNTLVTSEKEFSGIACNADGQLYATMKDGNLYKVNATTGELTLVGATGYNPNYAQSLQFDKLTGNLYWCYSDSNSDHFMQVDPTTGVATVLQEYTGATTGLSFPLSLVKFSDTEAKFTMLAKDVTVNYDIVRDMEDETSPVEFSGITSNVVVKQGGDNKYQPLTPLTIQLIDDISGSDVDIISADGITIKVLKGTLNGTTIEYDETNPLTLETFEADMQPGYYKIVAEPTDATTSPYTGTASLAFQTLAGYPVEVAANGFITYYSNENLTLSDDNDVAKLYTITSVSGNIATATEIEIANAGMPFIIRNTSDEKQTFLLIPTENQINQAVYPGFKGTLEGKTFTDDDMAVADHYVLNNLKFVWVKDAGTIAAHRCWLEMLKNSAARQLNIVFGDATGITAVSGSAADNGDIYDLNGRKVQKPVKKGVYIQNGKKKVMK